MLAVIDKYFKIIFPVFSFLIYSSILIPYFINNNIQPIINDSSIWIMYVIAFLGYLSFFWLILLVYTYKKSSKKDHQVIQLGSFLAASLLLLAALILRFTDFSLDAKMNLLFCSYLIIIFSSIFLITLDSFENIIIKNANKVILIFVFVTFASVSVNFFVNRLNKSLTSSMLNYFSIGQYQAYIYPKKEICEQINICSQKYFILWNGSNFIAFKDDNKTKIISKRNLLLLNPIRE